MIALFALALACCGPTAFATEVTLDEVLRAAIRLSPSLGASISRTHAATHGIDLARSGLLPQLEFQAIDSTGFPGSSRQAAIHGIAGSPFREGLSAELTLRQTVWDFGRALSAIDVARTLEAFAGEDQKVAAISAQQTALEAFFDCSRARSRWDAYQEQVRESALLEEQIDHFVRIGQRSIVDKNLSRFQTEQARTGAAGTEAELSANLDRLAVLTGISRNTLQCPPVPFNPEIPPEAPNDVESSPLVSRARAQARVSRAQLEQARTENYPLLVTAGSVGYLQSSRLVDKQAYSIAVGVVFPLFEGFAIQSNIQKQSALADAQDAELDAARLALADLNSRLDRIIRAEQVSLPLLAQQERLARDGLALAKRRFFRLQGEVVDLRESLRDLEEAAFGRIDSAARLGTAAGDRRLLNGLAASARAGTR